MESTLDLDGTFAVDGYPGIAWRALGWETVDDEDTFWSGYKVPTGMLKMRMVGDDHTFVIDPDDLTPLDDDAYCGCCGAIGCVWGAVS